MAASIHAGDVLAGRYRMVDLLVEADGSWIWNAHDRLLHRPVAIHLIGTDDPRADVLIDTARDVAGLTDRRTLRVLDCNRTETFCYVVNEWSQGTSLDVALEANGPMPPVRAAWLVHQVADILVTLHSAGITHGHVAPASVMIDENGEIRVIGTGVEAALLGLPTSDRDGDVHGLAALLYAALTGRWPGRHHTALPKAPRSGDRFLRPRQVRAGIPRALDLICDEVLNGLDHHTAASLGGSLGASLSNGLSNGLGSVFGQREPHHLSTAAGVRDALEEFLGEHESEMSLPAQSAPDALAPVHRPWQPPDESDASRGVASPPPPAPDADARARTEVESAPEPGPDAGPDADADSAFTVAGGTDPGIPVFDDSGDVGWVSVGPNPGTDSVSSERPPESPARGATGRPLFASEDATRVRQARLAQLRAEGASGFDDPDGTSTGKHRAASPGPVKSLLTGGSLLPGRGSRAESDASEPSRAPTPVPLNSQHRVPEEYWSWDTTNGSTGSGLIPVVPGGPVPGRNWMRLAWLIGVGALVLLVVTGIWHSRSAERSPEPDERPPTAVPTTLPSPEPFTGLAATDFDPRDSSGEEYPEDAPLAVDGDVATFWGTSTYKQQLGPGGIKDGVGLVVDLGQPEVLREVAVTVAGGETAMQVFVTDEAPTTVDGLEPVASGSGADEIVMTLDEATTTRFVTVWLTALPQQDGGFRGKVAEIALLG